MLEKYLPADVPQGKRKEFLQTLEEITNATGRLMLFAGDQKVEHLNNDFYGRASPKTITTRNIFLK